MHVPRRRVLQATAATATAGVAGCSSLTETTQLLVVRNRSDSTRSVTVTIRRAPDGTATGDPASTSTEPTATTRGTSPRFVVDFDLELEAGGRTELTQAIPSDGAFEVIATVPDLGTGRGGYTDTESVRVTIQDDDVTVAAFTPE